MRYCYSKVIFVFFVSTTIQSLPSNYWKVDCIIVPDIRSWSWPDRLQGLISFSLPVQISQVTFSVPEQNQSNCKPALCRSSLSFLRFDNWQTTVHRIFQSQNAICTSKNQVHGDQICDYKFCISISHSAIIIAKMWLNFAHPMSCVLSKVAKVRCCKDVDVRNVGSAFRSVVKRQQS